MRLRSKRVGNARLGPGATVGSYRLERLLGRGGMGAVYLATHLHLKRRVALKVLSPELSFDPIFRERFHREAVAQAALDHPNIVPLYEAGADQGYAFLAMRYVDGRTLKDLIASATLDSTTALRFLAQVADALEAAHEAGIVHRDVKPQNILIEGGTAFLADFGLTKIDGARDLTRTGHQLGTLDYMSPEQFRNESPTPRSDVYSLAAVLYECLSGSVPFKRDSDVALMYAHLEDPLPPLSDAVPGFPSQLDPLFETAMSKAPERRPASARALIAAVADLLAVPLPASSAATPRPPLTVSTAPATEPPRTRAPARWLLGALVLCAGGVGAGVATSAISHSGDSTERPPAQVSRRVRVGSADFDVPAAWQVRDSPKAASKSFALGANTLTLQVVPDARPVLTRLAAGGARLISAGGYRAEAYALGDQHPSKPRVAYLFPLAANDVLATCETSRAKAGECTRIVGTIRLNAPARANLPGAAYGAAIDRTLTGLGATQRKLRVRLHAASTSRAQATTAEALGKAFAHAATAVSRLRVRDVPVNTGTDLAAALSKVARAYGSLASAARRESSPTYAEAVRAVTRAERDATKATSRLRAKLTRV